MKILSEEVIIIICMMPTKIFLEIIASTNQGERMYFYNNRNPIKRQKPCAKNHRNHILYYVGFFSLPHQNTKLKSHNHFLNKPILSKSSQSFNYYFIYRYKFLLSMYHKVFRLSKKNSMDKERNTDQHNRMKGAKQE